MSFLENVEWAVTVTYPHHWAVGGESYRNLAKCLDVSFEKSDRWEKAMKLFEAEGTA